MRLLLVEDEEGLVSALRIGLRREGYAVDVSTTCADARVKLAVHAYDLVILDVNLPDGDGFSSRRRSVPIGSRVPPDPTSGSSCSPPAADCRTGYGTGRRSRRLCGQTLCAG